MEDKKNQRPASEQEGRTANENDKSRNKGRNENVQKAHDEAEKDILNDAELSAHSPNDDLDEGETARLGDGKNPLI